MKSRPFNLIMVITGSLALIFSLAMAGSLTPPGPPGSTMKTIDEVYNALGGTFDSSGLLADEDGNLIQNLKYISNNLFWASSGDDIYNLNSGNVGIGTATPGAKLDVAGSGIIGSGTSLATLILNKSGTATVGEPGKSSSKLILRGSGYSAAAFQTETVDDTFGVGLWTSLELDSSGYPVISYYDDTNGTLKLVHCNDANCADSDESIETVDDTALVGAFTSLELDSSGYPVISYYDADNGTLKLTHCNDEECSGGDESIETVDATSGVGYYTSLELDSSGYPVISYYDDNNGTLKLTHCNDADCSGGDESIETVDATAWVGLYTSLELDSSGYPVISYLDADNGTLKLTHCNDANCADSDESIETVDDTALVGAFTSLELDSSGYPVISYYDADNGTLKLTHCNDDECSGGDELIETVDNMSGNSESTSLKLDASGLEVISYLSDTDTLKLAKRLSPGVGDVDISFQNIVTDAADYRLAVRNNDNVELLTITSSGNVGIGTDNPEYNLDINGALRLQPSSAPTGANGVMYYDSGANKFRCYENGAWVDCTGFWTQSGSDIYTSDTEWNVNIGNVGFFSGETKLADPDVLPTNISQGVSFSPDSTYLAVAHYTSPFVTIYKRSGDTFTKLADPATLPTSTGWGASFSPDNTYLAIAHSTSPYITIYKRSGDTFTKLANPANLPTGEGYGVSFSPDNTYLAVAHRNSPYITIYKRSGDTFTKLANPAELPPGFGASASFSINSTYLAVGNYNSPPYITIYKRSGDTFTKLANPDVLPAGDGRGTSFSPDGTYLAVAHSTSPYITIYKRSGDTFTKLPNPANLPVYGGFSVSFSNDGTYLAVGNADYFTNYHIVIYKRSGDIFTKLADPAILPTSTGLGVSFSPDSTYLAVAHYTSPFVTIYKGSYGGNLYVGNSLGVGTTSPQGLLDINGLLTVLSSGKVGIGTTNPIAKLTVSGDIVSGNILPASAPIIAEISRTTTQISDADDVGQYASLAIGADSLPIISYINYTDNRLTITKCGNAACSSGNTTTQITDAINIGQETSIAIGADGLPIISYYNNGQGDLMITKCGNAACSSGSTTTQIIDADDVGRYTSISIGTDGLPIISHYNEDDGDLMITKCGNSACSSGNTTTQITNAEDVGRYASIAIGTDGLPIISYFNATDGDLMITKCGGSACSSGNTTTQIADAETVGWYPSITIGADGLPTISYHNFTDGDLMITKCGNADCSSGNTTTQISDADDVGEYTSIAIGIDGLPAVSYRNQTDGDLMITKCGNAACSLGNTTTQISDTDVVGEYNTSIAIGADGLPIISYYNLSDDDLMVIKCADSACADETGTALTGGSQLGGWMANPRSYSVPFQTINTLQIANPTTFQNFSILTAGAERLTITPTSEIYLNPQGGKVTVGTAAPLATLTVNGDIAPASAPSITEISRTTTQIANPDVFATYTSIAIGTDGLPIIFYQDEYGDDVGITKCGNSVCSAGNTTTLISDVDWSGYDGVSIAVGSDGLPVISYYNWTDGDPMIIKCGNAACSAGNTTTQIADAGDIGDWSSIAIGADGLPIISHGKSPGGDLMITKCGNADCSDNTATQIIDADSVGGYTSIAIGTDGLPVISHYNWTDGDLMVTKCGNTDCSSSTTAQVTDADDVGEFTSIAIGADGLPIISYYNDTDGDLMITKCGNIDCSASNTTTQIADADRFDDGTSIAIGTDGLPIISYYNYTDGELMITKCGNSACSAGNTTTQIASTDDVGYRSSVAIGTDGLPIISYGNYDDGSLMVTKCADSSCAGATGTALTGGSQLGGWMANPRSYSVPFQTINTLQIANPTTFQNFSILTAGSERITITPSGSVGIGTATPQSKLQVEGYIQLDDGNTAAPPAGDCDAAAEEGRLYYDATNDNLYVCSGASGWRKITTGAPDIAENYSTFDSTLEVGDVLAVDPENPAYVIKSTKPYQSDLMGVFSWNRSALGPDEENSVQVALVGRVEVKVSTENGEIKIGDALTSSSQPGIAMKATQAGRAIGLALEPFDGSAEDNPEGEQAPDGAGKILVFVNLHWVGNDLTVGENGSGEIVSSSTEELRTGLAALGLVVGEEGVLEIQTLKAKKVITEELEIKDKITGEIYCTWIENGEWIKVKGECQPAASEQSSNEPSESPSDSQIEEEEPPSEPPLESSDEGLNGATEPPPEPVPPPEEPVFSEPPPTEQPPPPPVE